MTLGIKEIKVETSANSLDDSIHEMENTTLAAFRDEALNQVNGTAYFGLRPAGGPRVIVFLCATAAGEILKLKNMFTFIDDAPVDWNIKTLADMFKQTVTGAGISFCSLHDERNNCRSIILCATDQKSIQMIESVFTIS